MSKLVGKSSAELAKALLDALFPDEPAANVTLRIIKRNDEKRLLTVITNTVTKADGTPIIDHDADVIKIGNLEDCFIKSFAKGGLGMGDEMHDESSGIDVVQHFTFSREEWAALGESMGVEMPVGTMPEVGIAKLRVNDDGAWAKVKSGEYREVSIAGDGERTAL